MSKARAAEASRLPHARSIAGGGKLLQVSSVPLEQIRQQEACRDEEVAGRFFPGAESAEDSFADHGEQIYIMIFRDLYFSVLLDLSLTTSHYFTSFASLVV